MKIVKIINFYYKLLHLFNFDNHRNFRKKLILQNNSKKDNLYDYGEGMFYQSIPPIKLNGLRDTKKRIKLVEFVEKKDPKAVLVIQGDHGGGFGKNDLEVQQDILKTFTLLKINNTHCKNFDLSNKLDMINTARLLLSCATNQKPNLIEKKSYLKINDRLVKY
jgi:hypothetical protein